MLPAPVSFGFLVLGVLLAAVGVAARRRRGEAGSLEGVAVLFTLFGAAQLAWRWLDA